MGRSCASYGAQFTAVAQQVFHLAMRRGGKIAKVAMARRLAVALYWMWRKGWNYEQSKSSVRRVENPALMLEYPLLRPGTRGYEVPESFDSCACALTLRSLRGLVLRNAHSGGE